MTDTSRRDLFKGAAVTGLAAAAAPAFAQGAAPLADPKTKYPSQPFPEQRQKWPALQRNMHPVPDCGEASYRGSGRLAGRKALRLPSGSANRSAPPPEMQPRSPHCAAPARHSRRR